MVNPKLRASQVGCIDVVALGIASEEEARETLSAATTAFSGKISA